MKVFANGNWCDVRKTAALARSEQVRGYVPTLELRAKRSSRMKRKLRYWFMLSINKIV